MTWTWQMWNPPGNDNELLMRLQFVDMIECWDLLTRSSLARKIDRRYRPGVGFRLDPNLRASRHIVNHHESSYCAIVLMYCVYCFKLQYARS